MVKLLFFYSTLKLEEVLNLNSTINSNIYRSNIRFWYIL